MNQFTIKDLENLSGIKAHTIRMWEQRYSFLKPKRTLTNIRYYSDDELKTILNIALLNKYGYKISLIDKMPEPEVNAKILSLSNLDAQQDKVINELIRTMVDLDMDRFEAIFDSYIKQKGVDKAITEIIFPFLERIGILWLTSNINPAQEHLVTNLIRQKLIVGIEGVNSLVKVNKTILLFLPEGEYHELGLLYTYYLLKNRGINVLYLGANLPLKDLVFVCQLKKPDFLYTHLTSAKNFNFERFLANTRKLLPDVNLVISGQLTLTHQKKIPSGILFKRSLQQVMEFIADL